MLSRDNGWYQDWVCVRNWHRDGVLHLHVVVSIKADIRDWDRHCHADRITTCRSRMRRGVRFRNAAVGGREIGVNWRITCCKYRFGRVGIDADQKDW